MLPTHQSLFLLLFSFQFISSDAQSTAKTLQDDWISPKGPDSATNIDLGQQYGIEWTKDLFSWFSILIPQADITNVDLWVTGVYEHQFTHLVASRVNINATRKLFWGVQIPTDEFAVTPYWIFRFFASGQDPNGPNATSQWLGSPQFIIVNKTTAASTMSSVPNATSTTAAPQSTTTRILGASSSSSLSTGGKAGAGIGAAISAILLVGIGYYSARRKQSSSTGAATPRAPPYAPPVYNNTSPGREYPEVTAVQKPGSYRNTQSSHYDQSPLLQQQQQQQQPPPPPLPQSPYQNVPYGHGPFAQVVQVPIAELEHQDRQSSSGLTGLDAETATVDRV